MYFRNVVVILAGSTFLLIGLLTGSCWAGQSLAELRKAQDVEYEELRSLYDRKANQTVPKVNGQIDINSPEYKALFNEYTQKRTGISQKYKQLDPRGASVYSLLADPKFKGKIQNTGSLPANVNADVDLKANDVESAKDLANHWSNKKGSAKPQYYTIDNPTVPTTTPPEDFNKVIKVVNPDTDTTLWTPETEEIRKAKVKDPDAWTTSGGQKGTGNLEMSRDKRGYNLDNEKKFLHADRPIGDTPGIHDEDLKTFSKSISKAGGDQGAMISKNNPEFYEQATKMQKYGDPVEAGIVNLGDSPEVRKQKIKQWKQTARDEMNRAKKRSEKLGDLSDRTRENLAQQMRDQGNDDIAQHIEGNRKKVAASNAEAVAQNERLLAERDEILGANKDTKIVDTGDADVGGTSRNMSAAVDEDLGQIKVGPPSSKKDEPVKNFIQDHVPEGDEKAIRKAQQPFTDNGGIKKDPDKPIPVKGDPELADLADPDTKHVKKPAGDPDLAAEVKKSRANSTSKDVANELGPTKQQRAGVGGDTPADTKIAPGKKTTVVDADVDTGTRTKRVEADIDIPASTKGQRAGFGVDASADTKIAPGRKTTVVDVDVDSGTRTTIKRTGADIDVPTSKNKTDIDGSIDASSVVETSVQVFQSGTKAAGNAIDQNRDLNSGDAVEVVKDMTPGVREYEATKAALEKRRLESLERRERIRQLESKESLTSEQEDELHHLRHEELRNTDSAGADFSAAVVGGMDHYLKKKDQRKKEQGREGQEDSFLDDGIPMAIDMAVDAANVVNPVNQIGTPLAEGVGEVMTWEQRQAWASQKDTMTKHLNSEATRIDNDAQRNVALLNELMENGDLSDPEVQKHMDALIAEIQTGREKLEKLNAVADEHLGEVDPEKLAYVRNLSTSLPDAAALNDWRNQKTEEQRLAENCPDGTIKINPDGEPKKCATCAELEAEFYSSRSQGYITYSEGLLTRAASCDWPSVARERIRQDEAQADCDSQKPGSSPAFSGDSYECRCVVGMVALGDGDSQRCVSCDELYTDFNVAMGANDKDFGQTIVNRSAGCNWIAEGQRRIDEYSRCPENTVRLSDESNNIHCVPCAELYGDFNAAVDGEDRGYAQLILDAASNCGWVAAGKDKLNRARSCPENTVKLSDEDDNIQCVSCDILYGDFNGALSGNDLEYAQSLIEFAPNCGWTRTAAQRIENARGCPDDTVKLSDQNDAVQCVPCEALHNDFNGAVSGNDLEYAQSLMDLAPNCGWTRTAAQRIRNAQRCPAGTVKLSDQSDMVECVPCETLYNDYVAASNQGDSGYARDLISLAGSCGWAQAAAQQTNDAEMQAIYDRKCDEMAPGSYAVIKGDRYDCLCPDHMLVMSGPSGTSCQTCEQVGNMLNGALRNNNLNGVKSLMSGAQKCGWYDQAVQIVTNIERERQQKNQQAWDAHNAWSMSMMLNMMNEMNNGGSDDIPPGYYDKKKGQKHTNVSKPPKQTYSKPSKTKQPPKVKTPPKTKKTPTKTRTTYTKPTKKKDTRSKSGSSSSKKCPPGTVSSSGVCLQVASGEDRSGTVTDDSKLLEEGLKRRQQNLDKMRQRARQ